MAPAPAVLATALEVWMPVLASAGHQASRWQEDQTSVSAMKVSQPPLTPPRLLLDQSEPQASSILASTALQA